jgi:hypothetical protein
VLCITFAEVYKMTLLSKNVVYTAVFNNYDYIPAVNPRWSCDFVCFTANPELVSRGWQVVMVQLNDEPPEQANRRYKMLPHKYFSNYERKRRNVT